MQPRAKRFSIIALGAYAMHVEFTPSVLPETVTTSRQVEHLVQGVATSDGAGVKLTRVLTNEWQQRLDLF